MGKLQGLRPRLDRLAPKVGWLDEGPAGSRARDARLAWRAWYKTARWQRLRWSVLVDAAFTCAMCGSVAESRRMVADHKVAHRGNAELFWDRGNLQALCKGCHDGAKQRAEAGAARQG